MTAPGNPIEAVRERLDGGRNWCKNAWGEGPGPNCINGAVAAVCAPWGVTHLIGEVVMEQYPERVTDPDERGSLAAMDFNNHPLTTWPEMDAVLDKASIRWDEQVS